MKSLLWKECHENLKWAALAMLLAGVSSIKEVILFPTLRPEVF